MARLLDIIREDEPVDLASRQLPLIIDDSLTMIMDLNGLNTICDAPLIHGKKMDEFIRKFTILTTEEIRASFKVSCKDMLAILSQTEPCIGCRRSVERLFCDLMKSGHPALDPLIITPDGFLCIKDEVLESPQLLYTILHGHGVRLNDLVEKQQRNRKSQRCVLHSLEIQRMRPLPNAWKEVWDSMDAPCKQEIALIETDTLDDTLETYLQKHRFCAECRNKVLLACSLLTREPEPAKEKGYIPILYSGIKRCIADNHVHLPTITEYIGTLISRAQPEIMGRERHAKTLEIAQEEVLTCLGICIADRLHRVYRRLREEETIYKVLAAVAVHALSRNFEMAVEVKRGISQLELLYEEFAREELIKQQRREKLRLKRKKKKERRYETEEKENSCDCSSVRQNDDTKSCTCVELKSPTQNIDRHKLQVLDPKNKGLLTCKCSDCSKKKSNISQTRTRSEPTFPVKKIASAQEVTVKNDTTETEMKFSNVNSSEQSISNKQLSDENSSDTWESCKTVEEIDEDQWHYDVKNSNDLVDTWIKPRKNKYTMWIEMKPNEMFKKNHFNEQFMDCGYSSEHNISSASSFSSLPSSPEGSEMACNDECCNHEGKCHDTLCDKFIHSNFCISLLKEGGLTLTQMLEDSCFSDQDEKESFIPTEEVLEFKSQMQQLTQKREELRNKLRERFAILCSNYRPLIRIKLDCNNSM